MFSKFSCRSLKAKFYHLNQFTEQCIFFLGFRRKRCEGFKNFPLSANIIHPSGNIFIIKNFFDLIKAVVVEPFSSFNNFRHVYVNNSNILVVE